MWHSHGGVETPLHYDGSTTSSHSSAGVRRSCSSRPARAFDDIRSEAQRTTTASSPTSSRRATRAASRPLPGSSARRHPPSWRRALFANVLVAPRHAARRRSENLSLGFWLSSHSGQRLEHWWLSTRVPRPRQGAGALGGAGLRRGDGRRAASAAAGCFSWTFPIVTAGGAAAATRLATLR